MNIYSQLVDILTEAIFGADAVLTASQAFLIEQASVYLSLGVTLLPIIFVVGLTFRLIRV